MAVVFDERWMGLHGIGRFATELSQRLTLQHLGLPRSPSHPLDCVAMSASMLRRPRDVFFSPGYNAPVFGLSRYVFVVHDLNHIDVDANSNVLKRLYYRFVLRRACRSALGLLTVSEFTARRIAAWADVPRERIHVVGNGVSAAFTPQGDTHAEGCDYFLVVGNRKDHKNEARVIAAFAALAAGRQNVRLVFTGVPSPALQTEIARCALGHAVRFTGPLSDAELAAHYRGAVGLVFPSLYEGFGLPVVEAMSCGTPVITSTTTSLPEVAGDAALLVDPLSTEAITAAMARLLDEPLLREELGRRGVQQARKFSWDVVSHRVELLLQTFRSKVAPMKIAIVHEWLVNIAGSEKVVAEILKIWPDADLFAVIDFLSPEERTKISGKIATTTFIQRLPQAKKRYQTYLPLMPSAIEQLDLSGYDLIISSSHAVAKGVLVGPDQVHISYVHSPIRYAWDFHHQYLREAGLVKGFKSFLARGILHYLRMWDQRTASGVDHFVANSAFIGRRIMKAYRRPSQVIYPPVDTEAFGMREAKDDFYLTASRMVPYKKMAMIVEAFAAMPDKKLVVIGDGPEFEKAKAIATPNVTLMGYQPFDVLRDHMQRAKAFVFAAEEDFGITPVEAQACGTPVIAFGRGGALETVCGLDSPAPTGVFYDAQSTTALCAAVDAFEHQIHRFSATACRAQAERFSVARFRREFKDHVDQCMAASRDPVAMAKPAPTFRVVPAPAAALALAEKQAA